MNTELRMEHQKRFICSNDEQGRYEKCIIDDLLYAYPEFVNEIDYDYILRAAKNFEKDGDREL